jgi:hypothetical protein
VGFIFGDGLADAFATSIFFGLGFGVGVGFGLGVGLRGGLGVGFGGTLTTGVGLGFGVGVAVAVGFGNWMSLFSDVRTGRSSSDSSGLTGVGSGIVGKDSLDFGIAP